MLFEAWGVCHDGSTHLQHVKDAENSRFSLSGAQVVFTLRTDRSVTGGLKFRRMTLSFSPTACFSSVAATDVYQARSTHTAGCRVCCMMQGVGCGVWDVSGVGCGAWGVVRGVLRV